jgi:pimeloyl-ACP methyl ester carboxylesterase
MLHLDGKAEALKSPLVKALLDRKWIVIAPDLRGTGETKPTNEAIGGAPDHHIAEHGLWLGRPLLGQWISDVQALLDWMAAQPIIDKEQLAVVGIGAAGVIAICAAGLGDARVTSVAAIRMMFSYVTDQAFAPGTHMGILAPGILQAGDIDHLAALCVPRKLVILDRITPDGGKLTDKELKESYEFTGAMYKLHGAEKKLVISNKFLSEEDIAMYL